MNRNSVVSVLLSLVLLSTPAVLAGELDKATDSAKNMVKSGSEKVESSVKKEVKDTSKKTTSKSTKNSQNPLTKIENPIKK